MPDATPLYDYIPKSAEPVIPAITAASKTTDVTASSVAAAPKMPMPDKETITSRENKTALPKNLSLAIAYIVFQEDLNMYSSDEGFERGTMFPELFKPFTGKRGVLE